MRIIYVEDDAGTRFLASEKLAYLSSVKPANLADEVAKIFGLKPAPQTETKEEVKP